jgi:hypothetical protein
VSYVYAARVAPDPGNVYYIRSTDLGMTFSAPLQLNTDTTTRAQWQPNLSVAEDGSLLAVWYDERETTNCVKGDETVPCYRMWARKSTDEGATWLADMEFSDVVTPLAGQPDPGIIAEYAGDYDYSYHVGNQHLHPWMDGRVTINNQSQQDTFFDKEPAAGATATPTPTPGPIQLRAQQKRVGGINTVRLAWRGATSPNVDIYRNNVLIATQPNNPGVYIDSTGDTGRAQYIYRVCEAGTARCSNDVLVRFPQ